MNVKVASTAVTLDIAGQTAGVCRRLIFKASGFIHRFGNVTANRWMWAREVGSVPKSRTIQQRRTGGDQKILPVCTSTRKVSK